MTSSIRITDDPARALAVLRGVERFAVDGSSAEQLAEGCTLLDVVEGGRVVGAIALEVKGAFAFITAGAGTGEQTDAAEAIRQTEDMARCMGARRIALLTRRLGMVRNLVRDGYAIHQAELVKDL